MIPAAMTPYSTTDLPKKIWILEGGKFGQLALGRIGSHLPGVEITLVDNRQEVEAAGGPGYGYTFPPCAYGGGMA